MGHFLKIYDSFMIYGKSSENEKLINYYKKCGFKHLNTIDLDNTKGLPSHYKGKLALLEMSLNKEP